MTKVMLYDTIFILIKKVRTAIGVIISLIKKVRTVKMVEDTLKDISKESNGVKPRVYQNLCM